MNWLFLLCSVIYVFLSGRKELSEMKVVILEVPKFMRGIVRKMFKM